MNNILIYINIEIILFMRRLGRFSIARFAEFKDYKDFKNFKGGYQKRGDG